MRLKNISIKNTAPVGKRFLEWFGRAFLRGFSFKDRGFLLIKKYDYGR